MRKARRLWKKCPLFTFQEMAAAYPGYTRDDLLDDLRRRTPRARKKRKNPLAKYGRYGEIEHLMGQFRLTHDFSFVLKAIRLRAIIARPYRLRVKLEGKTCERHYSPLIPYQQMVTFVGKVNHCRSWAEFEALEKEFTQYNHVS